MPEASLQIRVLGSGAGGGSPQWNCRCTVCEAVRARVPGTSPRTQASLAVSADNERWVLINAAPELLQQIAATPALHPRQGRRHSPIEAVVLTGGEVDQVAGLLSLREREPFALYASSAVHQTLASSPIFGALNPEVVSRRELSMGAPERLLDGAGEPLGITVEAFSVPGKVPLYEEQPGQTPQLDAVTEHTVALKISTPESSFFFVPCCALVSDELKARLQGAQLLLFDGTLFRDDELIVAELGQKTGRRMGHISISGPQGSISELGPLAIERKIFIHLNNSNPVLLQDSPERRLVEDHGWEVAFDTMEIRC